MSMNHKCLTPEDEKSPLPPFAKEGIKVPLWQRGIEGDLKFFPVKPAAAETIL